MSQQEVIKVDGRFTCLHCDIDKSWTLVVELRNNTDAEVENLIKWAISRQLKETIVPNYPEPPHQLQHTINKYPTTVEMDNANCLACGHTRESHLPEGCSGVLCECKLYRTDIKETK